MPTINSAKRDYMKNDKKIIFNFKLLWRMGRPLGLSCYTLPSDDEKPLIKVTSIDVLIFSVVTCLNIYLTHYNYYFWDKVFLLHKKDTLFTVGIKLITTGTLLFTLVGAFVMFFMRERIWYIIVTLQDIITEVSVELCKSV